MIEEIVTYYVPGIVWFYYAFLGEQCRAPIEESYAILVSCYFASSIFLLLPTLNMCSKKFCCDEFCWIPFLYFIYLLGKLILLIIMLTNVQNEYYREWDDNLCPELETWTLAWLIVNYCMLGISFIYLIIFIAVAFCDCDYYDEYDYEY